MRKGLFLVLVGLLFDSSAATYYVSTSGRSGAAGTEADPCSVIQDAVAKAVSGDTVIVAPGVYNTGGVSNVYARVSITNAITLKSSHGAAATIIEGSGVGYYGTTDARRGIYMTTGVVDGFTIRNGTTSGVSTNAFISRGGGILYDKTPVDNVVRVKNCIIKDNKAFIGGGVYGTVTVGNCALMGNTHVVSPDFGGDNGYYITAINCFFDANVTVQGYALAGDATTKAQAINSIFSANGAYRPMVHTTVSYSCTPFLDGIGTVNGGGNIITNNPKVNASTWRPYTNSACLNTGGITWNSIPVASLLPTDMNGNSRTNGNYDIGPVEWQIYKTTNLTASADSSGVVLGWTANEPDVSFYNVYRATTDVLSAAARIASGIAVAGVSMTYTDSTAGFRTNYYYWIQATNTAARTSGSFIAHSFSDSVSGSRLTLTNAIPTFSMPSGSIFTNSVSLSVSGTNIYYRLNDEAEVYSATNFALFVSSDAVLTAQSRSSDKWDSGIATAKLYRAYQLMVNNQTNYLIAGTVTNITAREIANRPFVGWSGYTNSAERTIILTMPPQDVELAAVYEPAVGQVGSVSVSSDADRILLEWSGIPGALLYEIQRGDSIEGAFAFVAQTDLTFYQDTTAVPGRTYYYKVRAFAVSQIDEEQAGAFSEVVSGMRPALLEVVASGFVQPLPSSAGDCSLSVSANMEWTAISRAAWMTVKSVTTEGAVFAILSNSDTTNSRTGVIRFILGEGVLTNDYSVTQSGNRRPDQPVGISPSGTGVDPFNVLLTASPYSDAEGDAQSNTEWRVNGVVTANPIERLAYATDCVWQVRYQDPYSWSDWSTALSFTTLVPELSLSLAATNAPKEGLVFDFTVTSNCQWEVAVDADWLAYVRTANQVSVTVERNTGDARTGTLRIHPLGTNGWMQTVTVAQAEWPIPPAPIPLLPTDNAVVTGSVHLVLQMVGGISNTEWRINGQLTNSISDAARFTNAVLIQRGVTNSWSARFTDGVRWSASSPTNRFYWMKKDTVYVSTNGNDSADGESWEHAFRTIQKGIDSAPIGGTVLVGNGVYNTGGGFLSGLEAVVLLTNSVTLRSVGGADKTIIQARMNGGFGRCVYVKTNSVMEGFTLTGGRTMSVSDSSGRGGAIYSENNLQSSFGSCIISNNSAQNGIVYQDSGGSFTFESCLFSGNSSVGLFAGRLPTNRFYNCTFVRNSIGGLLNNAMLYNTLVVSNTVNTIASLSGSNNSIGTFSAAQFVKFANNDFRLLPSAVSCIDKGTTNFLPYVLGQTDLAGKPRIQGRYPDIGAYETTPPPPTILRVF